MKQHIRSERHAALDHFAPPDRPRFIAPAPVRRRTWWQSLRDLLRLGR